MELSSYSVTVYLIFLMISGVFDLFFGARQRTKSSRQAQARRKILRGGAWIIIASLLLAMLRLGVIGPWTVFISAGILLLLNEYLLVAVEKIRSKQSSPTVSEQKEDWGSVRSRGKRRFVLIYVVGFGFGAFWPGLILKIMFMESFPFYWLALLILAGSVWGYLSGARDWDLKEREYLELNNHDNLAG